MTGEPTARDLLPVLDKVMGLIADLHSKNVYLQKQLGFIVGMVADTSESLWQVEDVQPAILRGVEDIVSRSRFCDAFITDAQALEWYNRIHKAIDPEFKPVQRLPQHVKNVEHREPSMGKGGVDL
mgnify:CR=1 FL=1